MNNTAPHLIPVAPPLPPRRGLSYSAVPKILLGLGALCLLIASATFLAVSWSTLGIGGRTAVLAALTLSALGATLALHRRGLRIAAESMSVVALGMLALDVYGAAAAGLLGGIDHAGTTLLAGTLLALGGAAFGLSASGRLPRLAAPQVVMGVGLALAYAGGAATGSGHPFIAGDLAVLVAGALTVVSRRAGLPIQQWSCLAAAGLAWTVTTLTAADDALTHPTLHQMWITGSGWSLLLSAAVLLAPAAVLRDRDLLLIGGSGSALIVTAALTVPVVGSSFTTVDTVALSTTAAWAAVLLLVRGRLRIVAIAPTALGALVLSAPLIVTAAVDLVRWGHVAGIFSRPFLIALHGPQAPVAPLLLVPSALLVVAAIPLMIAAPSRRDLPRWAAFGALVAGLSGALTAATYDVPLAVPAGILALTALAAAALAVRGDRATSAFHTSTFLATTAVAVVAALPSAGLTGAVAAAGLLAAAVLALLGTTSATRVLGEVALVPTAVLAVVGLVEQLGHDRAWIAVPVMLAVGVLAVLRPVPWVEVPAMVISVVLMPVSLPVAADPLGLLSLWLLVAGGLFCATALVHANRRPLAGVGAGLLMLAAWVRLADQHVHVVEAYTLPVAAALVVLGLLHLHRTPSAGTAEALLPGLLTATLPSLLLALGDPLTMRALILGAGCLGLVLVGAGVRWSAPLLTGAGVGIVLVLRELGPYADVVPQWVWIGLAGLLLTVAGITWERQLRDLKRAVGAIGQLR